MGIIFSDKAKRMQIKDLLGTSKAWILNGLQAGRDGVDDSLGFGTMPHRLTKDDLEKLRDEFIYVEDDGESIYTRFEKPTNEIREILGLEPQDNPFNMF